ncbi:hypothetical protein GCM10023335_02980 [Streptomyces siamensis]|uniref:Uncharacterized protein n=1 Tax=Streptomyces siamensis TaxID=1274986 RepID=A0ABP9IEK4_9ACTN
MAAVRAAGRWPCGRPESGRRGAAPAGLRAVVTKAVEIRVQRGERGGGLFEVRQVPGFGHGLEPPVDQDERATLLALLRRVGPRDEGS